MKRINHKDFGIDPIIVEPMNISERKAFWRNEKEKEYTKKHQEQDTQWLRRNR